VGKVAHRSNINQVFIYAIAIDFIRGSIVPSGNSIALLKFTSISKKNKMSTMYSKAKKAPVDSSSIKHILYGMYVAVYKSKNIIIRFQTSLNLLYGMIIRGHDFSILISTSSFFLLLTNNCLPNS